MSMNSNSHNQALAHLEHMDISKILKARRPMADFETPGPELKRESPAHRMLRKSRERNEA